MSGAPLNGVLPWVYSRSNALMRVMSDMAANPLASIEQTAGRIQDRGQEMNRLLMAIGDPKTRDQALPQAVDMSMGLLGAAPAGMAKLVKPLGSSPHYATDNLGEYTPLLYRETSADRAVDFLPNSASQPQTLWFSNEPSMALGQGVNKGVTMEFDAKNIPGQLSLKKPMARQSYESGLAEFVTNDANAAQIGQNLQSIRITKDQQKGPYFRRIQGLLKDWTVTREQDGSLVLTRP